MSLGRASRLHLHSAFTRAAQARHDPRKLGRNASSAPKPPSQTTARPHINNIRTPTCSRDEAFRLRQAFGETGVRSRVFAQRSGHLHTQPSLQRAAHCGQMAFHVRYPAVVLFPTPDDDAGGKDVYQGERG
jgi:hypothetical protein